MLDDPAGVRGFRFRAKLLLVVVAAVVDVAMDDEAAAPGAFRLKLSAPAPGVTAVVAGAPRVSPVVLDEAGVVVSEAKSVGPALVVAVAGAAAAGCVAPTPVAAGVAKVKDKPARVVGCAELPMEPMLKLEVAPAWAALPPVNEKPPGVVDGATGVPEELNTNPAGAAPWLVVTALETALVRAPLPSPKPLGCAAAGAAAVLLRLSFGVLIPKENPGPPVEDVTAPKLNPGV